MAKSTLISSLVELASDNVVSVRSAAILTIVLIFPCLDISKCLRQLLTICMDVFLVDAKKTTILPLVKQLCDKSMSRDDPTATTITKEFGRFISGLQNIMSSQDIVWFLNCYKMLAHRGLTRAGDSRGDPAMVDSMLTCVLFTIILATFRTWFAEITVLIIYQQWPS